MPVNSRCLLSATNYLSQFHNPKMLRMLREQQAAGHWHGGPTAGREGLHPRPGTGARLRPRTCVLPWDASGVEHPLHLVGAHGHEAQRHHLGGRAGRAQMRPLFRSCPHPNATHRLDLFTVQFTAIRDHGVDSISQAGSLHVRVLDEHQVLQGDSRACREAATRVRGGPSVWASRLLSPVHPAYSLR